MKNIQVVNIGFIDSEGRILLNHRKDGFKENENIWELIGGGVEENELPKAAIIREINEELNFEIDEKKNNLLHIGHYEFEFQIVNRDYHAQVDLFKADFPGFNCFAPTQEITQNGLRLFTFEEALKLPILPIAKRLLPVLAVQI